jgi:hypothetical protein
MTRQQSQEEFLSLRPHLHPPAAGDRFAAGGGIDLHLDFPWYQWVQFGYVAALETKSSNWPEKKTRYFLQTVVGSGVDGRRLLLQIVVEV